MRTGRSSTSRERTARGFREETLSSRRSIRTAADKPSRPGVAGTVDGVTAGASFDLERILSVVRAGGHVHVDRRGQRGGRGGPALRYRQRLGRGCAEDWRTITSRVLAAGAVKVSSRAPSSSTATRSRFDTLSMNAMRSVAVVAFRLTVHVAPTKPSISTL